MAQDVEILDDPFSYEPTFKPQFFVLGYLNEYLGRDTGPDIDAAVGVTMLTHSPTDRLATVERFFPSEDHLVDEFWRRWSLGERKKASQLSRGRKRDRRVTSPFGAAHPLD